MASAIPSSSSPLLMILLIAAGALVLDAIVYLLTHRKALSRSAAPWATRRRADRSGHRCPAVAVPAPSSRRERPRGPVAPVDTPPESPRARRPDAAPARPPCHAKHDLRLRPQRL